ARARVGPLPTSPFVSRVADVRNLRCIMLSAALAQKHIIGRIGNTEEGTALITCALDHASLGVDALDARSAGQLARAALGCDLQLEPCNILGGYRRGPGGHPAAHPAARGELPIPSPQVAAHPFSLPPEVRER